MLCGVFLTQSRATSECRWSLLLGKDSRHHTVLVPQRFPCWPWSLCPKHIDTLSARPPQFLLLGGWHQWLEPASFFLALSLFTLLEYSPKLFLSSSVVFHVIITPTVFPLSITVLFSILNFHDTVRKRGAGPCWGTLCPALKLWTAANCPSRLMIKAKGGPSLRKIAKTG